MSVGYNNVPAPSEERVVSHNNCPTGIREVLSLIGDKWSILLVATLHHSPMRFNELRRSIDGISQRMLTRTLRELERQGLVLRTVTPTTPPSVEYALTPLGQTLLEPMKTLIAWTEENYPTMHKSQQRYDKSQVKKDR